MYRHTIVLCSSNINVGMLVSSIDIMLCYWIFKRIQPHVYNLTYTTSRIQPHVYNLTYTTSHIQPHVYNLTYTTSRIQPHVYNLTYSTSREHCHLSWNYRRHFNRQTEAGAWESNCSGSVSAPSQSPEDGSAICKFYMQLMSSSTKPVRSPTCVAYISCVFSPDYVTLVAYISADT